MLKNKITFQNYFIYTCIFITLYNFIFNVSEYQTIAGLLIQGCLCHMEERFLFTKIQTVMIKRISTSMVLILGCFSAFSQTDSTAPAAPPPPTFTGSVDAYYRYNFANAKDAEGGQITNNKTSFTNSQNSFELGMVSLQAAHSFWKSQCFCRFRFWQKSTGI